MILHLCLTFIVSSVDFIFLVQYNFVDIYIYIFFFCLIHRLSFAGMSLSIQYCTIFLGYKLRTENVL